jgi:hypothetical protein
MGTKLMGWCKKNLLRVLGTRIYIMSFDTVGALSLDALSEYSSWDMP